MIQTDMQVMQTEPVAWMTEDGRVASNDTKQNSMSTPSKEAFNIPLYLFCTPEQTTITAIPVGLSDILLEAADLISSLPDELVSRWPLADELRGFSYMVSHIAQPEQPKDKS